MFQRHLKRSDTSGLRTASGRVQPLLEDESLVQVLPAQYNSNFSEHKTYILSGCLGGIGRSITKWMVKQGTRSFVFIALQASTDSPQRVSQLERQFR
ncbi:hypothetical protein GJ744_001398 [Endocarpon pusillum]|uniref:Ketoreductase (KR) domain-containing protein n=1 Tax=Endocarpon pusillum TaxID=364733 RepID=A0A8H7ANR6_9EURO|nr:hypothetical protein GJ744_001398 [Endocarpon pusillum]